jgi:CBS domain-containing protein
MGHERDSGTRGYPLAPSVAASVPLSIAAAVMRRRCLEGLVVLDRGRVCGVLTDRDLLRVAAESPPSINELSVSEVCCRSLADLMAPDPLLVPTEASMAEAANSMLSAGVGTALTVGDDGVKGVVTAGDIALGGLTSRLDELTVDDVAVEVPALSLEDGVEHAVALGRVAEGRPLPVVEDGRAIGTVQIPFSASARTAGAELDAPALPPFGRPGARRSPRFYAFHQEAVGKRPQSRS